MVVYLTGIHPSTLRLFFREFSIIGVPVMNIPVVCTKSGEYFLALNNGQYLPTKKLKVMIPKTGKCESSVVKTHSSLESFQIDISQSMSEVNATSAPFVMQSVSVQNLPVKTLQAVAENFKSCNSSVESSDIPKKVKSCEINIPALQDMSSDNSTLNGNSSGFLRCRKIPHIAKLEPCAASAVKDVIVLAENFSRSLCRTAKSGNSATDTDSYNKSSESFQMDITTSQDMPKVRKSITASHAEQSPQVQNLSTLVFFDLETTGLPYRGAPKVQITELFMVAVSKKDFEKSQFSDLQDVRVVNKMRICVRPTVGVSPRAASITGLNDCNLQDHQTFDKDTAIMIQIFIAKLPKPVCLLAHNGNLFDFPLLKAELQNVGVQLPVDILTADTLHAFRRTSSCFSSTDNMLAPSSKVKSKGQTNRPSYALHKLYANYFNKEAVSSHSAEGDCTALMMLCHKAKDSILPWICQNTQQFTSFKPMWN